MNCPVFTIEITNTKFKLHTPNLYYIGKEKWKQMKPKRFLSCPVLKAVDAFSSCKKRHIRNNGLNFGNPWKKGLFLAKIWKNEENLEQIKNNALIWKSYKQKGLKVGKNLRNKSVRNLTLFLTRRECVYSFSLVFTHHRQLSIEI